MNTTVTGAQVWQRWKQARQLVLLATFEDSLTGTRVRDFCQSLSQSLGRECEVIEHIWLFSTFRLRELRQIAAEEACAADLVIISVHRADSLPDEVKGWIDLWIGRKPSRQSVLLALVDPDYEGAPHSVEEYLRETARRGGMNFLLETKEAPLPRWQAH